MEHLYNELKYKIVDLLDLEDIDPNEIGDEEFFFDEGLGLDSVDVLELVVMLERDYGIKIEDREEGEKVFITIKTLAEYIVVNRAF